MLVYLGIFALAGRIPEINPKVPEYDPLTTCSTFTNRLAEDYKVCASETHLIASWYVLKILFSCFHCSTFSLFHILEKNMIGMALWVLLMEQPKGHVAKIAIIIRPLRKCTRLGMDGICPIRLKYGVHATMPFALPLQRVLPIQPTFVQVGPSHNQAIPKPCEIELFINVYFFVSFSVSCPFLVCFFVRCINLIYSIKT